MVAFKSWKDAYIFLKEYGNFSCLNCEYGSDNLDLSIEHTDSEYARLFCSHWVAMTRLDYEFVCAKWKHKNTGKTLEDLDCHSWDLSEHIIKKLDKGDRKWSIDEIERLINNEELEE